MNNDTAAPSSPSLSPSPPREIAGWRFGAFELDLGQRRLTRCGEPVPLQPLAFEVLAYLIRERHRVATQDDLLAACWSGRSVTGGVVARAMMKLRQAVGHVEPQAHLVQTVPRAGYRFIAEVETRFAPPRMPAAPGDCFGTLAVSSLALLPVENRSNDPVLGWVELGLPSLIAGHLRRAAVAGLVGVEEVLVALQGSGAPGRAPLDPLRTVFERLHPRFAWRAGLSSDAGGYRLHFALHAPGAVLHEATVVCDDAAEAAMQVAQRLLHWLAQADAVSAAPATDLGDAFLNEALRRTLRKSREENLVEAEHLLDLLHDAGARCAEIDLESARVALLLGRPHATQALHRLERRATSQSCVPLQLESLLLRAVRLEQLGQMAAASRVTREASARAAAAGLGELEIRATVMCARQTAVGMGEGARAMMSQTIWRAEVSGNRLLLRDAYAALGHIAAVEQDWVAAARHHAMGLSIARALPGPVRAMPLIGLSQARLQLGQLREARATGMEAWACASQAGLRPTQGRAALAAASVLVALRQRGALERLLAELDGLGDDRSVAMEVARESRCRATLLSLEGRHDEALACIAHAQRASRRHPVLSAACVQDRLRTLFAAGRHGELAQLCDSGRSAPAACLDNRVQAWFDLALACREHAVHPDPRRTLQWLDPLVSSGAPSQPQALACLGAAWLHLDLGEPAQARARLSQVQAWREQSPVGLLVDLKLQEALGNEHAADLLRRACAEDFSESARPGRPGACGGLAELLWQAPVS